MRGLLNDIKVESPQTLADALKLLSKHNSTQCKIKIISGATDLGVLLNSGHLTHNYFLDIWALRKKMSYIKLEKKEIKIGALTTFSQIRDDNFIKKYFPNLSKAANLVGGVQIQNRGTIGGNIANASPAADSVPALLSYDARLVLQSEGKSRTVSLDEFYKGYKDLELKPCEIITEIVLSLPSKNSKHYYRKVGTRQAQAISKVVASGVLVIGPKAIVKSITISLGSVGPYSLRCKNLEKYLAGKKINKNNLDQILKEARSFLSKDISPKDDIRSTKSYREFVSINLIGEFLKCLN